MIKLYEWFETPKEIFLVQELLDGEPLYERIQNYYKQNETLDEVSVRNLFKQILYALNFIHK